MRCIESPEGRPARPRAQAAFAGHDAERHKPLLHADRIVVAGLARLPYPIPGSVPYLADLLCGCDAKLTCAVMAYLRRWRMRAAVPHLRSVLRREALPPAVRAAACETLALLEPGRTRVS